MKASDLFVKSLENEGVEYIFGIPGEENLDFLESLRTSSIKLIITRHEQSAGFMAATYGRLTGKVGVCLSTLGPGATNFATPAAYAQLGAMPMLMITGQKPILTSKQGRFQIVDIVRMMNPLTKYAEQIHHGDRIPSMVHEAFRIAEDERPGAVHLELPEDIAREDTSAHVVTTGRPRRPIAEDKAIGLVLDELMAARSPLIIVGAGANRKRVSNMLTGLIEKTGIPVISTQMGKGVIDETHACAIGTAALSDGDYVHDALAHADVIISIGHDVIEKPPFFMKEDGKQRVVHINFDPANIDEVYFPHVEVVGDIANALWQIEEKIDMEKTAWDFTEIFAVRETVQEKIGGKSDDKSFPVKPQRYVADVRAVMGKDDILALDNGMYKLWFARNYPAMAPNTVLLDNALATMGAGLPSAMMAKMLHPERKVLAVVGDGGFMMNSQELETAVRLQLDIVVVILNNNSYGMIKWKQEADHFDDFGLGFGNPDFIQYAQSYGAVGHRITAAEEFRPALEKAFTDGGVQIIDLAVDDTEHIKVLTEELQER